MSFIELMLIGIAMLALVTVMGLFAGRMLDYFEPLEPTQKEIDELLKRADQEVADRPHLKAITTPRGKV